MGVLESLEDLSGGPWAIKVDVGNNPDCFENKVNVWSDHSGLSVWMAEGSDTLFALDFDGLGTARVDFNRRVISFQPAVVALTSDTVQHLVVDQVIPRLIAHIGALVLHAGAVINDGRVILFVGPSGRGKSTLVASLHAAGWSLLGDDANIVSSENGKFRVEPVYRSLRLLPDSLASLDSVLPAGSSAVPSGKKRQILFPVAAARTDILNLAVIFILGCPKVTRNIHIRRMGGAEACVALLANSFSLRPTQVEDAKRRHALTSAVATQIPILELAYPRDYSRLPELQATLLHVLTEL